MDMGLVDVGADHKGMIALGEPLGKFHAQAVGFFRGDFSGFEGLAHMIGNHIVRATHPPGGGDVLPFCQQKFGIGGPAVTPIASYQFPVICLLRIFYIVDDVADRLALSAALANMQRHDACGCHRRSLLSQ